jgi:hypothetical protein
MSATLAALGATAVSLLGLVTAACQGNGAGEQPTVGADPLRSQEPCLIESVPRVRPEVPAVAFAYGEGPVFVGLGTGDGVVRYTVDTRRHQGWYYYKTLWAIAPTYAGGVVISGRQVGGSNELRFNAGAGFPGHKETQLRLPPDNSGKWRYGPSDTLIKAPGCYRFSVAGEGLKETIIFEARD